MRRLLEGGVYLWGPALIRENIVFQKKTKQGDGVGGGGEGWGFGIARNIEEIASGISKHGISRDDQEKIMWNFQGSWF